MSGKIVGLHGSLPKVREVNELWIAALEEELKLARSGEVIGGVIIKNYFDGVSSFDCAGMIGGFSMVGAATAAQDCLLRIAMDDE